MSWRELLGAKFRFQAAKWGPWTKNVAGYAVRGIQANISEHLQEHDGATPIHFDEWLSDEFGGHSICCLDIRMVVTQFCNVNLPSSNLTKIKKPILYIFSRLPGSGKTTLAQNLAKQAHAVYLRIDTIEQALRDFCAIDVQGEGYGLSHKIASDNLRLGMSVVSDSCNPIDLTRREWEQAALEAGANYINIEVICPDAHEHRRRVESRISTVPGLRMPNWNEVENREYHPWTARRIVINTANQTEMQCVDDLLFKLSGWQA